MANIRFLPYIGKYVIESAILVGAIFVGGIQIVANDAEQAASALTAFLIAGARIAPAILRLQQSATSLIGNKASAIRSLSLIKILNSTNDLGFELRKNQPKLDISEEISIKLSEVSFRYDNAKAFAIQNLSIQIKHGDQIAITGASGSGKTTLIDLIIGINEPTSGEVLIAGMKPRILIQNNPGIISYMTQDSFLMNGTIRDNICANLNEWVSDQDILEVIEKVDLHEFLRNKSDGLDFKVGEGGKFLSGGQKQRLCLARAIISKPKILVLDEGTSAIDGLSEDTIMQYISLLKRNTTVIIVAHRMSSILGADQILFLKDGTLIGCGNFQKLREEVPDFNVQVEAMKFQRQSKVQLNQNKL
jgi:ABC-type multidrug transport system fused ATPase/permease subunit